MSIFDKINIREAPFTPSVNTGTILDVATGYFIAGANNSIILNGGVTLTNGRTGRPQIFKSTLTSFDVINAYARCPGSDCLFQDTEHAQVQDRLLAMATVPIPDSNKFKLSSQEGYHAEDFFDVIRAIAEEKIKHKKDYLVEIPHIDPKTNKQRIMFRPTFVAVDSWSNMESRVMKNILSPKIEIQDGEVISKASIGDSDTNTIYMKDGLIKKKILSELYSLAERAGIYIFFTAHVGNRVEMGYTPSPKVLQHMKQQDQPKNVGSNFLFLMMNLLDCRSSKILLSDSKDTLYPSKLANTSAQDLNEVQQIVTRCKSNTSGQQITSVVSQVEGVLPALTNYHLLKSDKYWGMDGSALRHNCVLYPDISLTRTTVNDKLRETPKLQRAFEILSQLYYIQKNWTLKNPPVDFTIDPKVLAEKIFTSKLEDDILSSRGWWTYEFDGHKVNQPYLSLVDILRIVENTKKPKSNVIPLKKAA